MKVLITGTAGVLATDLCPVLKTAGYEVLRTDTNCDKKTRHLDVRDSSKVARLMGRDRPRFAIHLAAETYVDRCEVEVDHTIELTP